MMQSRDLFEVLVREHAEMLGVFTESLLGPSAAAEELFQETLVVAWRRLEDFDKTRPFGPWLRGIAARLALAARREGGRRALPMTPEVVAAVERRCAALQRQPGDTLAEKLAPLRACVDALPDRFQEAIRLRYEDEVKGETLAARLGVTFENAKKLLQRGRRRLADCLDGKLLPEAQA